MKCLLFFHKYKVVRAEQETPQIPYGAPVAPFLDDRPYTIIYKVCQGCGKPKKKRIVGHWKLEDFNPPNRKEYKI